MSRTETPRAKRGVAGLVFVLCALLGALGLGLDFLRPVPVLAWAGEQPGARAALAIAAVFALVAAAQALRVLFGKREEGAD